MSVKENCSPNLQSFFELCRKGNVEKVSDWLQNRYKKLKSPLNFLRPTTPCSGWLAALREPSTFYTALHQASLHGHVELVELLVQNDLELVSSRDRRGCLPLHLAAWNGHYDIVVFLLNTDPGTVNAVNNAKECPLHLAALHGHSLLILFLLQRQADAQIRNARFETALDIAARTGKAEICRLLVQNCPALSLQSAAESTATSLYNHEISSKVVYPLHLAARYNNVDCVEVLCENGFDVNCVTFEGTALHVAAMFGHLECVKILIDFGADMSVKDSEGLTPLERLRECEEQKDSDLTHMIQSRHGWTECRQFIEERLQNGGTSPIRRKSPPSGDAQCAESMDPTIAAAAARGVVWRVIAGVPPPPTQPPSSLVTTNCSCIADGSPTQRSSGVNANNGRVGSDSASLNGGCVCRTNASSTLLLNSSPNKLTSGFGSVKSRVSSTSNGGGSSGVGLASGMVRRLFPKTSKKRLDVSLEGEVSSESGSFSSPSRISSNAQAQQCRYQCPPFYANVDDVSSQFVGSNCLFYDNVPDVANFDSRWMHNCCPPTNGCPNDVKFYPATIGVSNGHPHQQMRQRCERDKTSGQIVGIEDYDEHNHHTTGRGCGARDIDNASGGIYTLPKKSLDRPSVFHAFGNDYAGTYCDSVGQALTDPSGFNSECQCNWDNNQPFKIENYSSIKIHECAPIALPEETDVASTLSRCSKIKGIHYNQDGLFPSSSTTSLSASIDGKTGPECGKRDDDVLKDSCRSAESISSPPSKLSISSPPLSNTTLSKHSGRSADDRITTISPPASLCVNVAAYNDKKNSLNGAHSTSTAMLDSSTSCSSEKMDSTIGASDVDHSVEWQKIDEILSAIQRDSFFQLNKECADGETKKYAHNNDGYYVNEAHTKQLDLSGDVADAETLSVWLHMNVGFSRELAIQLGATLKTTGFDNFLLMKGTLRKRFMTELRFTDAVQSRLINYMHLHMKDCVRSVEEFDYLSDWLDSLALIDYLGTFAKSNFVHSTHDIIAAGLSRGDLEKMGITKVGHLARILHSLELCRSDGFSNTSNTISSSSMRSSTKGSSSKTDSFDSTKTDVADRGSSTNGVSRLNEDANFVKEECVNNGTNLNGFGYNCLLSDSFSSIDATTRRQMLLDSCVVFSAHYLGSMEISNVEGAEDCRRAMNASKKRIKQVNKVPQVILEISVGGVNVLDASTNHLTVQHEINRIQVVCQDELDLNCFAYIFQDGEKNFCHVYCVLTAGVAKDIIITLGEAFNLAFSLINEKPNSR